ncbi:MAG TPA: hypothetical protein VGO07_04435 [Candidatus Saccharimonadales bacterium]|jgi:hypothetical protein|nr:hypothetical protein [Candidatus Saccharimonadales bacterium]
MRQLRNKVKTGLILGAAVLVTVSTVLGSVYLANHLDQKAAGHSQTCAPGTGVNHRVVIQNDTVTPSNTQASLCDTLTITDLDGKKRLIAFGPHDDHVAYDGVQEKELSKGQSLTVTLVQAGSFRFHDHTQDEVQGTFSVNTPQH